MATYQEMYDIWNNNTLIARMAIAVVDQAQVINVENPATSNHANRLLWAKQTIGDPLHMARKMSADIIVQNKAATNAQILAATDAQLLSAVAAAVDVFANGTAV